MISIEKVFVDGYEEVIHTTSENGLNAYFSIHSTLLGPSLGGCRIWKYDSDEKALQDALNLSKAMTYKSSMAGINFGGGKSVVNIANTTKSRELLLEIGEVVETLKGRYVIAEDVGSSVADLTIVAENTNHVASLKDAGDPSQATAYGVMRAMEASVNYYSEMNDLYFSNFDNDVFENVKVFIEGMGNVGFNLAKFLQKRGAQIIATDINKMAEERAKDFFQETISWLDHDFLKSNPAVLKSIFKKSEQTAMVFAPCALGGIVSEENFDKVSSFDIICGSANNQLSHPLMGYMLAHHGILYAPDYVVNAGGVINCAQEVDGHYSAFDVAAHIDSIGLNCLKIFEQSRLTKKPTNYVADEMAQERLKKEEIRLSTIGMP